MRGSSLIGQNDMLRTQSAKVRTLNSPANGASFLPQSIVQSFFYWSVNQEAMSNIYRVTVHREEHGREDKKKGVQRQTPKQGRELAQWVRGLLSKHEDRRVDTQHPNKKLGSGIHVQAQGRKRAGVW